MLNFFSNIPAGGTVFNCLAVILGSLIGMAAGKFISEKMSTTIFNCMGLFTIYVGINMALATKNSILVLLSLVFGTVTGEFFNLDFKLNSLGDFLKSKFHSSNKNFTNGFVTATLLFCIGSMGILGALNDGIKHDPELLLTKGTMDGIMSVLLAGSFGSGVVCSIIPMFIYQGSLTFLASFCEPFITPEILSDLSGLGGLMVIAIGTNLLKITSLKLGDMLPALIYLFLFSIFIIA